MKSYSLDLRERIVAAVVGGQHKTAVSERFGVSRSTVKRYAKRQLSGLAPSKRPGRQRLLDAAGCEQLRKQVEAHQDWTLERHAEALVEATGVEIKKSSVGNYLKRLGITHKLGPKAPGLVLKKELHRYRARRKSASNVPKRCRRQEDEDACVYRRNECLR